MSVVKPFIRTPYNYDLDKASDEASIKDFGPSLTVQSQAEDLDLNVIMYRFGVTGRMPEGVEPLGYGDFTGVVDYASAHLAVRRANERFMEMPHEVRSRFQNDPQQFLEFCTTPGNEAELSRLGLTVKPPAPLATPAASAEPAPAATPAPAVT